MTQAVKGMVAGAAGTLALNAITYLDMLVRGRPPSTLPEQAAGRVMDKVEQTVGMQGAEDKAANRRPALGALMGYGTGLGIATIYSSFMPEWLAARVSPLVAGPALGLAAMIASDAPMAKMGLTDPATWSAADWMADVVPHLGYGLVTAAVLKWYSK